MELNEFKSAANLVLKGLGLHISHLTQHSEANGSLRVDVIYSINENGERINLRAHSIYTAALTERNIIECVEYVTLAGRLGLYGCLHTKKGAPSYIQWLNSTHRAPVAIPAPVAAMIRAEIEERDYIQSALAIGYVPADIGHEKHIFETSDYSHLLTR